MSEPTLESAGEVVRALRREADISLREMAEKLGWDKSRLSRIENNESKLSSSAISEIAEILGKPTELVLVRCFEASFPRSDWLKELRESALYRRLAKQ